uniref:Pentatricopeptide repeat-containing protein n=1 Tax=Solanum tuberosum TaxID=4113 RepID=M1AZF3_SOLTU
MQLSTALRSAHSSSLFFIKSITSSSSSSINQHLLFVLSNPNWRKHPSLNTLIPSLSPSHFSYFLLQNPNLNPHIVISFFYYLSTRNTLLFKPNPQSYAPFLRILISNNLFRVAERTRLSMIKSGETRDDAVFVMDFVREMRCRFKVDVWGYNKLLMCLSRFVMIDDMKCVYDDMLSDMIKPDIG